MSPTGLYTTTITTTFAAAAAAAVEIDRLRKPTVLRIRRR